MTERIGYYQGTLQLRNCPKQVISIVKKAVAGILAKEKRQGDGWDLYLTDQKALRQTGHWLQHHYGGQLTTSRKLHTQNRQTGKCVYRVTVLYRYLHLKPGTRVTIRDELYKVIRCSTKLHLKHLETNKKKMIAYKDLPRSLLRSER